MTTTDTITGDVEGDRPSDRRKVLPEQLSGEQIFGGSKMAIYAGIGSAAILKKWSDWYLPPDVRMFGYAFALAVIAGTILASFSTPDGMTVAEYIRRTGVHAVRQPTMLSARLGSTKEQPTNTSIPGRIARLPILRNNRWVDVSDTKRAQESVQVNRPFYHSPAVETDSGGVVGAIKVEPAAMAVASDEKWKNRVDSLADAIDSSVRYKTQFTSRMRAVDYGDRIETYAQREQEALDELAARHGGLDEAYDAAARGEIDEIDLGLLVRADLADERQDVIDLYDVTTLRREYFVSVRIEPEDVISQDYIESNTGGLANVPFGVGAYYRRKKLKELKRDGNHTEVLIDRLESQLQNLTRDLKKIDDVSARTITSLELSQVFADHYQAANIYATADYSDLVRMSPKPESEDGSSMYGVSHDYLGDSRPPDDVDEFFEGDESESESGGIGRNIRVPRVGGWSPFGSDDDDSDPEPASEPDSDGTSFVERIAAVNDYPLADVILSKEHLIDHYQTLIGPENVHVEPDEFMIIDRQLYSKSLSIRNWPAVPKKGILEPILREEEPGVAINVATHINPANQGKMSTKLADNEDTKRTMLEKAKDSKVPQLIDTYQNQYEEAAEMRAANRDSDYDLSKTNTHLELRSDDYGSIEDTIEKIRSSMDDEGTELREEDTVHYEGYLSMSPACDDRLEEPVMMFADGIARQFPWTSRNLHEPNGVEFGENMHTHEPLYLDLWNRDKGFDFGVYTSKGGGKTSTVTMVINKLKQIHGDGLMTIVIDPVQEFPNLTVTHGGERLVIGGDSGVNPFHLEGTPLDKLATIGRSAPYKHWVEKCMDFIEMFYADEGLDFSGKQGVWREAIKEAGRRLGITKNPETHFREWRVENGFSGDVPNPMDAIEIIDEMTERPEEWVRSVHGDPSPRKIEEREEKAVDIVNNDIQPFLPTGEYAHFCQQTDVELDEETTFWYIDMQQQESKTSLGLTMHVVYDMFYELIKTIDIPSLIFMDEFHYLLRDDLAQESLNMKIRHGRHWDLSFGTATQSLEDYFGEDDNDLVNNARVLFENQPVRIHHQENISDERAGEIDLNPEEAKFIRNAEAGSLEQGFSTALLYVEDKGTYPLMVKMDIHSDGGNPRETVMTEYTPSDHGENFYEYLLEHTDIADWRFAPSTESARKAAAETFGERMSAAAGTTPTAAAAAGAGAGDD